MNILNASVSCHIFSFKQQAAEKYFKNSILHLNVIAVIVIYKYCKQSYISYGNSIKLNIWHKKASQLFTSVVLHTKWVLQNIVLLIY